MKAYTTAMAAMPRISRKGGSKMSSGERFSFLLVWMEKEKEMGGLEECKGQN